MQVTALLGIPARELCQIPWEVRAHLSDRHVKHTPLRSFLVPHLGLGQSPRAAHRAKLQRCLIFQCPVACG